MEPSDSSTCFVCQWNASCYDNCSKRWIYGILHLLPDALFFEAKNLEGKNDPDHPWELFIKFSAISSMRMASSSFFYPSITLASTDSKITYWLSSFTNRDRAFHIIHHFFQSSLLASSKNIQNVKSSDGRRLPNESSTFGQGFLRSVNDSHETLKTAASSLSMQGQQLRNASCKVDDINEDLEVANRITNGIRSWFGRWKVPTALTEENIQVVSKDDIPYGFHFDCICCEVQGLKFGPPQECVLRLATHGLTILDTKQKIIHYFKWRDISRIQVMSCWEVTISEFCTGKPDITYTVTAAEMPTVLKELEKKVSEKVDFMERLSNRSDTCLIEREGKEERSRIARSNIGMDGETYALNQSSVAPHKQQLQEKRYITDEEANQLSQTLSSLKSLALDIQTEEDKQINALDQLLDSVDKTNASLTHVNKKINKMI